MTIDPYELREYQGLRVGDTVPLTKPDTMGSHWQPYSRDSFTISSIRLAEVAHCGPPPGCGFTVPLPCLIPGPKIDPTTGTYDTSQVPPSYISVMVSSVQHPEWRGKNVSIDCFLE